MISSSVFSRYAKSLADVVIEQQAADEVGRNLEVYREIFLAVPDLLVTFHNPAIPKEVKEKVFSELLARHPISQTAENFLKVLLDHNRLRFFHEIFDLYTKTLNERRGIVTAQVASAAPLSEAEQQALKESLARATGRSVVLEVQTDRELLGGLVVRIGSTVYDGSVLRQLEEMRRHLTE